MSCFLERANWKELFLTTVFLRQLLVKHITTKHLLSKEVRRGHLTQLQILIHRFQLIPTDFQQGCQNHSMWKEESFQQTMLGKLDVHV